MTSASSGVSDASASYKKFQKKLAPIKTGSEDTVSEIWKGNVQNLVRRASFVRVDESGHTPFPKATSNLRRKSYQRKLEYGE